MTIEGDGALNNTGHLRSCLLMTESRTDVYGKHAAAVIGTDTFLSPISTT